MTSVKEFNCETGEESFREYTKDELAAIKKQEKEDQLKEKALLTSAEAKNALLEKLGITEEEAKLLLS